VSGKGERQTQQHLALSISRSGVELRIQQRARRIGIRPSQRVVTKEGVHLRLCQRPQSAVAAEALVPERQDAAQTGAVEQPVQVIVQAKWVATSSGDAPVSVSRDVLPARST
jgi:hypothetical protein